MKGKDVQRNDLYSKLNFYMSEERLRKIESDIAMLKEFLDRVSCLASEVALALAAERVEKHQAIDPVISAKGLLAENPDGLTIFQMCDMVQGKFGGSDKSATQAQLMLDLPKDDEIQSVGRRWKDRVFTLKKRL